MDRSGTSSSPTVKVHRYLDDTLTVFYGPRKLADYDASGILINKQENAIE
jgi:hypothetical protein